MLSVLSIKQLGTEQAAGKLVFLSRMMQDQSRKL